MTYPGYAEALDLHLFVRRVTAPSVDAPGATATRLSLRCPGCGADAGPLPFGRTIACACGLNMHPDVAQLYVWRDRHDCGSIGVDGCDAATTSNAQYSASRGTA